MITAKEYLRQLKNLEIKIEQRKREYEQLISEAMGNNSPSLNPNKVQTSLTGDTMSEKISRCVDIQNECQWLMNKMITERHRIIGEIQTLQDPRYVQILYLHYVEGKRLEEVSCTMKKPNGDSYSYDHIASLHGFALQEFERVILKSHGNPKK